MENGLLDEKQKGKNNDFEDNLNLSCDDKK